MIMKSIANVATHLNVSAGAFYYAIATDALVETDGNIDLTAAGLWVREQQKSKPFFLWRRNFVNRFTSEEQVQIVGNAQGLVWWLLLMDMAKIDVNDLNVIGDVQNLVMLGYLTQNRAAEILSTATTS